MFQRKPDAFQAKMKFHKFDDLVAFSGSNCEPDSIAKCRGSTGSLDYRLFPWIAEKLFDILYPMCSAYTVTVDGRSDAVLFIQKIPENLVDD